MTGHAEDHTYPPCASCTLFPDVLKNTNRASFSLQASLPEHARSRDASGALFYMHLAMTCDMPQPSGIPLLFMS